MVACYIKNWGIGLKKMMKLEYKCIEIMLFNGKMVRNQCDETRKTLILECLSFVMLFLIIVSGNFLSVG